MQPTYIPWLGYFNMIDYADIFVLLDDVQLIKRSWQVRNRIKTGNGGLFLTIPVRKGKKNRAETMICETLIYEKCNWKDKHLKSIFLSYRRSSYFDEIFPFVRDLLSTECSSLSDFTINIIKVISARIGITTEFKRSSVLDITENKGDLRLVEICERLGCEIYISPQGSTCYINKHSHGGAFANSDIALYYHNYVPVKYTQLHGTFISHMSVIDLLFNEGFKNALPIIRSGRQRPIHYADLDLAL